MSVSMPRRLNLIVALSLALSCVSCTVVDKQHRQAQARLDANKLLVRQYYESVVSTGNVDLLPEFISPDYAEIYQGTRHPMGIEGARDHVLGVRRTYRDLRLTVEQQLADGEWVATALTARGMYKGEWLGMRSMNKPVEIFTVNLDRVVDGRIVEHTGAANMLVPMLEIGAVKAAGSDGTGDDPE